MKKNNVLLNCMDNIFEGAYFGKPYKTHDGRKAIYYHCRSDSTHELIVEACGPVIIYWSNGETTHNVNNKRLDIISKWTEDVNEEELDKLVEIEFPYFPDKTNLDKAYNKIIHDLRIAFKEGYRKALEKQHNYER